MNPESHRSCAAPAHVLVLRRHTSLCPTGTRACAAEAHAVVRRRYVSPAATARRITPEGWIACTINNLSITNNGSVDWTDETTYGEDDGRGNVYVFW